MQHGMDLSRLLGHTEIDQTSYSVFASGHAEYDQGTGKLVLTLDSYLHPVDQTRLEERIIPEWLPHPQEDREHVDPDEASDLAKEVFDRWCSKVAHTAPGLRK